MKSLPRLLVCLLVLLLVCVQTVSADEAAPAKERPAKGNLKLLTWNIQMLTILNGIPQLDKGQAMRAPWIIDYLNAQDYDVVVLQEVIDRRMTTLLKEGLKAQYPYIVAPPAKGGISGTTGGVMFASRIPLKYITHVVYKAGSGVDKLAEKGCVLVEAEVGGQRVQIAGTHLQAGDNASKEKQFGEIYEGIIKPHAEAGVPQILAGDMNVASDVDDEKPRFALLLKTTEMRNFPLDDARPYTVDADNSWKDPRQTPEHIDHVLLNPRGTSTTIVRQTVQRARQQHEGRTIDLADHYGVIAEVLVQK